MSQKILNLGAIYAKINDFIAKTNTDEGFVKSNGSIDNNGRLFTTTDNTNLNNSIKKTNNDEGFLKSNGSIDNSGTLITTSDKTKIDNSYQKTSQNTGFVRSNGTVEEIILTSENTTNDTQNLKKYTLKRGNTTIGTIDIPRDFFVQSATLKTCSTTGQPLNTLQLNDPYLDFVVNTKDSSSESHFYINVKDLVDTYTGDGSTIEIDNNNTIKVKDNVFADKVHQHEEMFLAIYPVGSIYMSVLDTNPGTLFGGTWKRLEDTFLLAAGNTYTNGATGGAATVTLSSNEMPNHTHTQNAHSHNVSSDRSFLTAEKDGSAVTASNYGCSISSLSGGNTHLVYSPEPQNSIMRVSNTGQTQAVNQTAGGGQAHENMPPYLVVYMWKRIAE